MKKYISALLLFAAALVWGCAFPVQKAASAVPAFTLCMVKFLLAALFLIPVIMITDARQKNGRRLFSKSGIDITKYELIGGAACGAALSLAAAFQQMGMERGVDAGSAAFITSLYVVIVPILALFLRKKSSVGVWISVGVAVIGFYLLCVGDGFTTDPNDFFVLIASVLFGVHILIIDHFSPKVDGVRMSLVQFAVASLVNLICIFIFERGTFSFELVFSHTLHLLFIGVVCIGIGNTLQIIGQKLYSSPAAATVILSTESVIGAIVAAITLGERMSARELIGCAVIFFAVIFSQLDPISAAKNKKKAAETLSESAENDENISINKD